MRKLAICAVMLTIVTGLKAQQDPQFTQWMFDKMSFNPATAGIDNACLKVFGRNQWTGLGAEPQTMMFEIEAPLKYFGIEAGPGALGAGLTFVNDRIGPYNITTIRLHASYKLTLNNSDELSAGFSLGSYGMQEREDWNPIDVLDPKLERQQKLGDNSFDLNFGVYYRKQDNFYAGASVTHLTGQDLSELSIGLNQHVWFMTGGKVDVNTDWAIKPNALVKYDLNVASVDVNVLAEWQKTIWGGLGYRLQDSFSAMAGFQYTWKGEQKGNKQNDFAARLGYSYDFNVLNELSTYNSGSHELFLSLCWKPNFLPLRKKHSNPRFL